MRACSPHLRQAAVRHLTLGQRSIRCPGIDEKDPKVLLDISPNLVRLADRPIVGAYRRAASFAEQVAGVAEVRTGEWLEATRMSAAARNESFFALSSARDAERTISSLTGLPSPARSALTEVTRLLAGRRALPALAAPFATAARTTRPRKS